MGASGSEALSNAASVFVGQVEAQLLIRPYVKGMTMSELLASMSGSMACVSGGVMAVYIGLGIKASYLLTASIMAAPGALVISKIVFPETEESETKGEVKIEVKKTNVNVIDAAAHGASASPLHETSRLGVSEVTLSCACGTSCVLPSESVATPYTLAVSPWASSSCRSAYSASSL